MIEVFKYEDDQQVLSLLARPQFSSTDLENTVSQVFSEIKNKGDQAILKYTSLFDGIDLDELMVKLEFDDSASMISENLKAAIDIAKNNIEAFHRAQRTNPIKLETTPGVSCWIEKKPIQKVGLYIPGGSAPLFSTILMLAIPAKLAGCKDIILCTPPNKEGKIDPVIKYTARLCGIDRIYKIGGIQAIGAMTFGTQTVPKVFKIFGPGNQYVTAAKQYATKFNIAIDMPAGPSELMIFSDETGNPAFIASDLLSQAEHGADSQVILLSTSPKLIEQVNKELEKQVNNLARKTIASDALKNSKAILVENSNQALGIINEYAPEHLILITSQEAIFIEGLINAGSVFLGNYTPESAGDYASGTNHTLPTNGFAKQYSGVNLDSFLKSISFQKISREGLNTLGPAIETMAAAENLDAHKNAVSIRLNYLKNND